VGIWVIVCVQKLSPHLQTFGPLPMFKIVFRYSPLYPKQLCLFCLIWLISASTDRIGCITNFCSIRAQKQQLQHRCLSKEKGKL